MAWFTLILGGGILLVGLIGQIYGIRTMRSTHSHDKNISKLVFTIGSVVVGLWVLAFAAVRLLHLDITGRW